MALPRALDDEDFDDDFDIETAKAKLFKDLAIDIFPPDSWEEWEIKALCRMGLAIWFGLEDECED